MIYDIVLRFAYDYPSAVKDARHILRIRLRDGEEQAVVAQSVRVTPKPDETVQGIDFFGNAVDHIHLHRPHEALRIEMRARVRVNARRVDLGHTPPRAIVAERALSTRDAGAASPAHFLGASRMIPAETGAAAYVAEIFDGLEDGAAGADVLSLTRHIYEDFTYAPGTTRIDTPVADVLKSRKGVCQDFAHLMISGLRGNGIPAAYVSGLLRTEPPPGRPRLEGSDAMHAWVKVWLGPETGWVGFDPTNGVATNTDHIEVAIGRDYADVSPIGGVLVTSGTQKTRHSVDVIPVGEDMVQGA